MNDKITRRRAIENSLMVSAAALTGLAFTKEEQHGPMDQGYRSNKKLPFRISLNTSTLMAYNLPVDQQIDMVTDAGFDGIELWMRDIKVYLDKGGKSSDLKKKLESGNLVLENIIGFSKWCSDNAQERKVAIDQLREEMLITASLGGAYIAAPVQGIEEIDPTKLGDYAKRYAAILKLGEETGVTPIIEIWGTGALHKVSDCAHIVISTGHPKATMLLDIYHIYRGGNDWDTVDCLNTGRMPVIHMNDYPSIPEREALTDGHRVLPGEGACPFDTVIPKLYGAGFRGALSVELFNKEYWATMDAKTMLKNSYVKTHQTIEKALDLA